MGSGRVPERYDPGKYWKSEIYESTRNVGSGRVPEMWDPGEYREGNIQVSTGKGRIQASTGNVGASTRNVGSGRVPER